MNNNSKKIADASIPCFHPGHNPPMHMVLEPGTYEHTCPSFGKKKVFKVPIVTC